MANPVFEMIFEVRWTDIDPLRHMRNTAYSDYATHQRFTYLADAGFPFSRLEEIGMSPVLFSDQQQYLREARLGHRLRFDLRMAGLAADASRWRIRHDAWRLPMEGDTGGAEGGESGRGEPIHTAVITLEGAWLDLTERRLAPPPPELARVFAGIPRHQSFEELPPIRRRD